MRVKFLRNTVADGKPVAVGDVLELPAQEAMYLIHIRKAEAVDETPAAEEQKPAPAPAFIPAEDEIEDADLNPEPIEKAVRRPRGKRKE